MASRFGLVLILFGVIALTIFVITFRVGQGDVRYLLVGALLSAFGLVIRRAAARNQEMRAERFQLVRRMRSGGEEEE